MLCLILRSDAQRLPSPRKAKDDTIEVDGNVIDCLPGGYFRVKINTGHKIMCTISGRIRINRIRIVLNDRVKVQLSPHDLTQGRISFRMSRILPTDNGPADIDKDDELSELQEVRSTE
eukprot:GHVT01045967.1.p1 GENE.GHVT01045967.1~~GHVT01045967.1.p1  ORF type:complete len:118 (-),score=4.47 GHVT01045967.1:826-1179(-)